MIHQLVYISTIRGDIIAAECDQILRVSRRNNARDGITGLLVVGTTRFLQLLEGPADAVDAAFARIRSDKRHFAAVVLSARDAEARACEGWAMGYVKGGDGADGGDVEATVASLVAPIEDATLRAQFVGFGEVQGGRERRAG